MIYSLRLCSFSLLVLFSSSTFLNCQKQTNANVFEHSVSVYAISDYTTVSRGTNADGTSIWQTDKAATGTAAYIENWRRSNGLILGGSYTKTESRLMNRRHVTFDHWNLERYKLDLLYEHRFFAGRRIQPDLGLGGFLIVLWGGDAPAHSHVNATGLDSLRGLIIPAGVTMRLNSRVSLKTGLLVDFGKASTYADSSYTPSPNRMYEPQIGLSFKLGSTRGSAF